MIKNIKKQSLIRQRVGLLVLGIGILTFSLPNFWERNPCVGAVCTTCPTAGYATDYTQLLAEDNGLSGFGIYELD